MEGSIMTMKPIVRYNSTYPSHIQVGMGAYVWPIDHQSDRVSNNSYAHTSKVVSYDKTTGEFETLNTRYIPE